MRITAEYTIWCDYCSLWIQTSDVNRKRDFERDMRLEGWKVIDGKTACPKCVKKLKAKENSGGSNT